MTHSRAGGRVLVRLLPLASGLLLLSALTGPAAVRPASSGGAPVPAATTPGDRSPAARPPVRTGRVHDTGGAAPSVRIHDIQGRGQVSPLAGSAVSAIGGIVTVVTANGLWMQDPKPDGDDATSEGIFVFTRTRPAVATGDRIEVDGRVNEFRPDGSRSANLTRTELDATSLRVTGHGAPLPAPVVIGGRSGRRAPTRIVENDLHGDATEPTGAGNGAGGGERAVFDPAEDGLDFYESMEGMRVAVDDAVVVGPRSPYGDLTVLPAGGAGASRRTARGGILLRPGDANPERLGIADTLVPIPDAGVGDRLPGRSTGVLDYGAGSFRLLLTATPQVVSGGLAAESTRPQRPDELALASVDLAGLDPSDPQATFDARAHEIVDRLKAPDLVTVEGLEDDSGPADDGTVAADQTVAQFIAAISAAGGPAYDWRSVDPRNDADGGEPGGNSRVGFLFRTDRGLSFTDRPGGTSGDAGDTASSRATTATRAADDGTGRPVLTLSPGRVDPAGPMWADTRKPLAGEFIWRGRRLFVIADHWTAPGGDDPLYGRRQPPATPSQTQRTAQAREVAGFVGSLRAIDPDAYVVVAGDLNDTGFSPALHALTGNGGLVDTSASLRKADRYSAIVDGNAELPDDILLSPAAAADPYEFDVVHTRAEFAAHAGEHDPVILRISPSGTAATRTAVGSAAGSGH